MRNRVLFLLLLSLNLFANENLAKRLILAYPLFLEKYEDNFIYFKDGSKLQFSTNNKDLSYEEIIQNSSLENQMSMKYIKIDENKNYIPAKNEDAGRFRNEEFFKKIYGKNRQEIEKNLVKIKWLEKSQNKTLWVTKINGIDKKLIEISKELDNLPKEFKKYIVNPDGVYNFRKISGTHRLSTHSFAIAIDLNKEYSNYWLWDKKGNNIEYKNKIPLEIVKIFEKHGFIWGGRWYHYDTMHFEYRPELLLD
ncbi:M15 family metallopeptidase [Aliarcobacter cryaerophilus]|uniref:M15 family metallopeptidase n=1 Tax=Aliarcobacter cryaerophilus TaxID=28198 RepID=UPI00318183E8